MLAVGFYRFYTKFAWRGQSSLRVSIGGLDNGGVQGVLDVHRKKQRWVAVRIAWGRDYPSLPTPCGQVEHHLHIAKPDPHGGKGRAAVIGRGLMLGI